ncbi:hypothetical protein PVAND_014777 [Polypedilum vanderplanki]|uniref:Uncharacterized protein n=1 Tax=Polypedilum vanderplanki TaxID=319348 RepID=A0A9J6BAQ4_POLVA|nr:hypothetical protein PVAND_014777 [Polypedilum vanderplanki]
MLLVGEKSPRIFAKFTEKSTFEDFEPFFNFTSENYIKNIEKIEIILTSAYQLLEHQRFKTIINLLNVKLEDPKNIETKKNITEQLSVISSIDQNIFKVIPFLTDVDLKNCSNIYYEFKENERKFKFYSLFLIETKKRIEKLQEIKTLISKTNYEKMQNMTEALKSYEKFYKIAETMTKIMKFLVYGFTKIFDLKKCFNQLPCGIFVPLNNSFDRYGPANNGFSACIYSDGSTVYIGAGFIKDETTNLKHQQIPGRINVNASQPGIFMENDGMEFFDNETVFYLVNHKDLKWINYTWHLAEDLINDSVQIHAIVKDFAIGRLKINDFVQIGKITKEDGFFVPKFFTLENNTKYETYEMLVCRKF